MEVAIFDVVCMSIERLCFGHARKTKFVRFEYKVSIKNCLGVIPGEIQRNEIDPGIERSKNLAPFRAVRDVINRGLLELITGPP